MAERPKRWVVRYRDAQDESCPVFRAVVTGHSREDVEERFLESPDGDGWKILTIERLKAREVHRYG